jgi:hypothetical protein
MMRSRELAMRAIAFAVIFLSGAACAARAQAIFAEPTPAYLVFGQTPDSCYAPPIRDTRRGQDSAQQRQQTNDLAAAGSGCAPR